MGFAENLQTIRKKNGLTQEALAEMLGVSRQAVSKWEQGDGYPEVEKLLEISKKLGVSLDSMMGLALLDSALAANDQDGVPPADGQDGTSKDDGLTPYQKEAAEELRRDRKKNRVLFFIAIVLIAGVLLSFLYYKWQKLIPGNMLDVATEFRFEIKYGGSYTCKKGDPGFAKIRDAMKKVTGRKTASQPESIMDYKLTIITPGRDITVMWNRDVQMLVDDQSYIIRLNHPETDFEKYFQM